MATGIWRGGLVSVAGWPVSWALALALVVLVPLAARLGPFHLAGVDPRLQLTLDWSLPAAVLGSGLALAHLSHQSDFLAQVAPRTRWWGELGLLVGLALLSQALLALGALVGGPHAGEPPRVPLRQASAAGLISLHLAALGCLWLRVPLRPGAHLVGWLVLLLGVPTLFEHAPLVLDIGRPLRHRGAPLGTPRAATVVLGGIAGLLILSRLVSTRRAVRGSPEGPRA